jgi:phage-related protein
VTCGGRHEVVFYTTASGGSPPQRDFEEFPVYVQADLLAQLERVANQDFTVVKLDVVARDVFECKKRFSSVQYRVLYTRAGPHDDVVVILCAFKKKTRAITDEDRASAISRLKDHRQQLRALGQAATRPTPALPAGSASRPSSRRQRGHR